MATFREQQENWEEQYLYQNAKKSRNAMRWKEETPDEYRTNYQRDIGRILYSNAFRRLRLKTQVFSASGLNQHNRTRLTHSLEVSQIAKSIARPLRLNTDLVEAIALGHDLGHTPFGHAGERALNKCISNKSTFNHNAQSVWILQRTFDNRRDINGDPLPGFNLTYDVVEGIWKHTSFKESINEFDGLNKLYPNRAASLEGQAVDISDGIAYIMHDVDDAIRNGLLKLTEVEDIWKLHLNSLHFDKSWGHHFIYDVISNSQNKDTVDFSPTFKELYKGLKALLFEKVIQSPEVSSLDQRGEEIVTAIYEFCLKNPEYVLKKYERRNRNIAIKFGIERVIVDYIQWLGDETANAVYDRITAGKPLAMKEEDISQGPLYIENELI